MKTEAEIVAYIEALELQPGEDIDGRRCSRLIELLPYSLAKRWLKPGASESGWSPKGVEHLHALCYQDLTFAWRKALDHRGLSAGLMASVIEDWVWLLCTVQEHRQILDAPYENYGAPKLVLAGRFLSMNVALSPHEMVMAERMARGEPCSPGCVEGCGH